MKVAWRQTRLLLWKDYLIRKRKLVSLGGAVWAALVVSSLVAVRNNIETQNVPTCQYPARALPSAGMLNFLQSFICSINNECSPMDQYEEIPLYQKSRLHKLERQFAPILYNESVLEVAAVMPNALKLVATFADVIDEPGFHHIGRDGLRVSELFIEPSRVKRYLVRSLNTDDRLLEDVMQAEISFQGLFSASLDPCEPRSLSKLLLMKNATSLEEFSKKLCPLTRENLERIVMQLLPEVNYRKYFKMLGNMLHKLNGNEWMGSVGGMLSAVFRLTHLDNLVPLELGTLVLDQTQRTVQSNFTYFNFTMIKTFMDLFEPTFGDTESYRSIRGIADSVIDGVQWLHGSVHRQSVMATGNTSSVREALSMVFQGLKQRQTTGFMIFDGVKHNIMKGLDALSEAVKGMEISLDKVFSVLSKLTSTIVDAFSPSTRHSILYYSTLLTKLIEGAHESVNKNMNMEQIVYDVSKRHTDGVAVVAALPPPVVGKMFDALSDAERTQIFTSKLNTPGQMFCDVRRLQSFFMVSKSEAESIRKQLCNDAWTNYVSDAVHAFGIFDVKNNINKMATLVVKETLGRENDEFLYTIEHDFDEIRSFVADLMREPKSLTIDWPQLFNVSGDSELFRVVRAKMPLAKRILITVHGALAREVVKQNPILEAKITPILIHSTTLVNTFNAELESYPRDLVDNFKQNYTGIVMSVMRTLLDREKTFKVLSTYSLTMFCNGVETSAQYLDFAPESDKQSITATLCSLTTKFEGTLEGESKLAKAVNSIMYGHLDPMKEINWTTLISGLKKLYSILELDFPYVFAPGTYNMDNNTVQQVANITERVKEYWFNVRHLDAAMHMGIKLGFNIMDLLDKKLFNMTSEQPMWDKMKQAMDGANSFLVVTNQMVRLVTAVSAKNESFDITYLPLTVTAVRRIIPNLPELLKNTVDVFVADNTSVTDATEVLNSRPAWPCSARSMADVLSISPSSAEAVKGFEILLCNGRDLQREWAEYVHAQKIRNILNKVQSNETEYEPHLFLKMSGNFDEFVKDMSQMQKILKKAVWSSSGNLSLVDAVKYITKVFNESNGDWNLYRKVFTKLDQVLSDVDTSPVNDSRPVYTIWDDYLKCNNNTYTDADCQYVARAGWKYTVQFMSTAMYHLVDDLLVYFEEVNAPNATLLQIMGFTRTTGLHVFYDKIADFMGVLLNSYWDQGFMNQIRKASKTAFWDCDSVVESLVIPLGSKVTSNDIRRVKPYVCPSILYWLSLPRGENAFLNVVAKPQYYFYTLQAKNLSSVFAPTLEKVLNFKNLLDNISKRNLTVAFNESIQEKVNRVVDKLTSFKLSKSDASYNIFNEINNKQFISALYLTRVAAIVNHVLETIGAFDASELPQLLSKDLDFFLKLFKRKPSAFLEIYFDAITEVLWKNDDQYQVVDALKNMCDNLKNNDTSKVMVMENERVKKQFCFRNYLYVHENVTDVNLENARETLITFVQGILKNEKIDEVDIYKFFNDRKELTHLLQLSMSYADDLTLPLYVKYLQNGLKHYAIILSFLTGEDWWGQLRLLYSGKYAGQFFDTVEDSFNIAEDVLTHLDKIKIVRILKDMSLNNTDLFCMSNLTLSDYIPDSTGALSRIKDDLCTVDSSDIFKELPPLLFASQGYDSELKLSKDINYTSIGIDISVVQQKLKLLKDGPESPMRPSWVTDEKLSNFKRVAANLFSKESVSKIVFGITGNLVDGITLFLNNSHCTVCSTLTTWLRQINLQLIKKDEYDTLICHLKEMTLSDTYNTLKNDFHWDMAFKELISKRNYTNLELNKALNQFLEHVSSNVRNMLSSNASRLQNCLGGDYGINALGNFTFHLSIVTKTLRLLRSAIPHLQEINGIKQNTFLVKLSEDVAHRLSILKPLKEMVDQPVIDRLGLEDAVLDITKIGNYTTIPVDRWLTLNNGETENICASYNCSEVASAIATNINQTDLFIKVSTLQLEEFWQFQWLSKILLHLEDLLIHVGNILSVGSHLDVEGIFQGRISALLDGGLIVLQKNTTNILINSLNGVLEELRPLLKDTDFDSDLQSLSKGLEALGTFRDSIIEGNNLSVEVSTLILNPETMERDISSLGINHTNFWSVAAPRIYAGRIDFKPLLASKEEHPHMKAFACQPTLTAQVIRPSDMDSVTTDDVYGAINDQWCQLSDEQVKQVIPVLIRNLNFTYILSNVVDMLLFDVYRASNLTEMEGKNVVSKYNKMLTLMPLIQENLSNISAVMSKEPLLAAFRNAGSVRDLLSSSEFMQHAGNMLCGKPLVTDNNRFYKAIAETKDFSTEADPRQLESLPTDFCRSLYKEILGIGGGKILWSFVKPLIMGKILFTPATPVVSQIMSKANTTFAQMSRMRDLVTGFAEGFNSIEILTQHKESLLTIRALMNSDRFAVLRSSFSKGTSVGGETMSSVDFTSLFEDLGDVRSMGGLIRKLSDLLGCVNLNRFVPMSDEHKMSNEAVKLTLVNEFSAGIVFNKQPDHLSNKVNYTIRMDIESVPTTSRKRNQFWTPGPEASFIENMRYFRGFVQIQDLIDKAIIDQAQQATNTTRVKRDAGEQADWAIYTQQMPYPCYKKDVFQSSLYESQALIVAFFFSLILTVSSAVRFTVHERESGNTMLMSVMGLRISNHTVSWFIASFLEMLVTVTVMFLVLKLGGILPHSDPFVLWLLMVNFGFSVIMFCYMVSKIFRSASLGAVCTAIFYLMTYLPYIIVLSMEASLSTIEKVFTSLSMSSGFCYSVLYVARYEAIGVGAQWHNVWRSPEPNDTMSIATTAFIVLFDAMLYAAVGSLYQRLTEYKSRDNLNNSTGSSEKAGISIVNVSKIYGEGTRKQKMALDNVSIELHRGQITTLLGHNGAGKTTLIKIITGMLKPTKGNIVIRTEHSTEDPSSVKLGVCPQNDVLIENMTSVEHLKFYAQLKSGKNYDEVELEVQSMLHILCFGGLAYEQVWRLSGGLRRRLCVALAFIAKPQLVLLDEPSSGVDPVARRDIWSLIVKLKEGRTVLLTTHHLDEAELLSDQVVIMHKGQIHTTGPSIEIKRSLGNGYKLTVFYAKSYHRNRIIIPEAHTKDTLNTWTEEPDLDHQQLSVEELSKQLLTAVRIVVKNAQLSDVRGKEVEIVLPFFDAEGLNNDFMSLCKLLETKQLELQFDTFNMDCSSLEQVFFNICHQVDSVERLQSDKSNIVDDDVIPPDTSTSSSSSSNEYTKATSAKGDTATLVPDNGPLRGTQFQQYSALLHKRYTHYKRNAWLLTLLFVLPTVFTTVAMGFSLIRPPADSEVSLLLHPELYGDTTEFVVPQPSTVNGTEDTKFAANVMKMLANSKLPITQWKENPQCECTSTRQQCQYDVYNTTLPGMLALPNTTILLDWATSTQEMYIEKRYGGWSSAQADDRSNLIAWYNNKGHHAMPAYINGLNTAILRTITNNEHANITTYSHPLKISEEQLSRSTLLQHVADVGIAAVILIGFSLIPAGAAIYIVTERESQQKRLQLLCGVSPVTYWCAAATWDIMVIIVNIVLTVCVLLCFGLPVFVERDNLSAICLLLFLFGFSCNAVVHTFEKAFKDASFANMILFCLNVFVGVSGLAILLILDLISDSDLTDNARWTLHKVFLLSPQFALGDGLIEIAKNSIQAQVLKRFGMETYKSPLNGGLITYHYVALIAVGLFMFVLNLAIESDWIEQYIMRRNASVGSGESEQDGEMEALEVATERYRVELAAMRARAVARPTHLHTIGNINAGFVNTEDKKGSLKRSSSGTLPRGGADIVQCLSLRKEYSAVSGKRVALHNLTLGLEAGQCMALLGENGAGKSTTFGMLTGQLHPTSGNILLHETPIRPRDLCQGNISYCPQNDAIDPLLTVREQLRFYCRLRGISTEHEVIHKTLATFDLRKYASVYTSKLSGGNKRKLCTAIALMGSSPLVLLDEPTSGMDPGARNVVASGVTAACNSGRAILLSTHALDDARRLAHRLALLQRGRLRTVGPVQQSLTRFGGGYVVGVRLSRGGDVPTVWSVIKARLPHAVLQAQHYCTIQFLLPVNSANKPASHTKLSYVFSEMAALQGQYDIEDYTINQSSLYQMFANFSDKKEESIDIEHLPSPERISRGQSEELVSVTAL